MPKVELHAIPQRNRTDYPPPFDRAVAGRWQRDVAGATGLRDFGVRQVTLEPGAWSAQRHWHVGEDEVVVIVAGEAMLVDDAGRHRLGPGDCAVFPMGEANGHHLVNESARPCVFFAFGRNSGTDCHYPDVDLHADGPTDLYFHKDGTPY